jgi:hypothetical protein
MTCTANSPEVLKAFLAACHRRIMPIQLMHSHAKPRGYNPQFPPHLIHDAFHALGAPIPSTNCCTTHSTAQHSITGYHPIQSKGITRFFHVCTRMQRSSNSASRSPSRLSHPNRPWNAMAMANRQLSENKIPGLFSLTYASRLT